MWNRTLTNRRMKWAGMAVIWLCMAGAGAVFAGEDARLAQLEAEIAALKAQITAMATAEAGSASVAELERRIDVLAAEIERLKLGEAAARADEAQYGYGPAASKVYRTKEGLSIGGYGELLYQRFDDERDDGVASGRTDELDLLRAVLYFGYRFNDRFLFNSEIEVEHAESGEGADGEVALEFAYLDYLHRPELNFRAGLVLVPMGFVNELHEPIVFHGSKRPDVERVILPTTWRENGFGLFGDIGPVSYRTYLITGFDAAGYSAGGLRGGRQKGSRSKAEDFAWVGRVDYHGVPGLTIGGSAYVGDAGQGLEDAASAEIGAKTQILEAHAEYRWRGLGLRALVARAEVEDVARLNRALSLTGNRSIGEELGGHYLEASYDVLSHRSSGEMQLIPFVRFEAYDTQKAVPVGFARNASNDVESLTMGISFRPIDRLVLKLDAQDYDNGAGTAVDQINLSLGYVF